MIGTVLEGKVPVATDLLEQLSQEVKETVANDFVLPPAPKELFTAAELWDLRRRQRRLTTLRRGIPSAS
ncbi:MAG: hypothetical protein ACKO6K_08740 [Chitinophagaceae bacterium]